MGTTTIEWATHSWNPFTGCNRVSPGCANCYALDSAASLKRREGGRARKARKEGKPEPKARYQVDGDPKKGSGPGFGFTVHWDKLANHNFPAGARVFVNSMSDVFHEDAPIEAIAQLWAAFASKPAVRWLVLTKRPERMLEILTDKEFMLNASRLVSGDTLMPVEWPLPNVWLGVTIENRRFVSRADILRATPAAVRFISAEPLLGPLIPDAVSMGTPTVPFGNRCWADGFAGPALDLTDIDWLIAGGESGRKHRPIDPDWVRALRDAVWEENVRRGKGDADGPGPAFFFKQWGGRNAKEGGRELDGRTWDEFPS